MRIAIIEDQALYRDTLRAQLTNEGFQVDESDAVDCVGDLNLEADYSAVVCDLRLSKPPGYAEAIRYLISHGITQVLACSQTGSGGYTSSRAIWQVIAAGASGYIDKAKNPRELTEAVQTIAGGGLWVGSVLAVHLLASGYVGSVDLKAVLETVAEGLRLDQACEACNVSIELIDPELRAVWSLVGDNDLQTELSKVSSRAIEALRLLADGKRQADLDQAMGYGSGSAANVLKKVRDWALAQDRYKDCAKRDTLLRVLIRDLGFSDSYMDT